MVSGEGTKTTELHSLYRSPNIVEMIMGRRLRWAGRVPRIEDGRRPFKILTGTPTGKRSSGRPGHTTEYRGTDFKEIGVNVRCCTGIDESFN